MKEILRGDFVKSSDEDERNPRRMILIIMSD